LSLAVVVEEAITAEAVEEADLEKGSVLVTPIQIVL
jgi:hypothetical protein